MSFSQFCAVLLVSGGGTTLVFCALRLYGKERRRSWFDLSPQDLGAFTWRGLILSSALGLYLELLLIRWISSEIRIFAYFKNFVLIACFLGFGLGCYLCRRSIVVLALLAPLLFLTLIIHLPWLPLRGVIASLPTLLGATSEVQIWGVGFLQLSGNAIVGLLVAAIVALPLFALLAVSFIPIGQLVGWYLENAPNGILAYSLNIVASLAGIMMYTALCFAAQPPVVWFAVAGALTVGMLWKVSRIRWIATVAFAACALLTTISTARPGARVYWSPYQKLALTPFYVGAELGGYDLETNSSSFQRIVDLSPRFVSRHPELFTQLPIELHSYNLPYRFAPNPPSVLILGSGMGNDVAAALRNGSERITAVEIDPLVLRLGHELHPEHPYDSPRVTTFVDDARSYIQNSSERFDLIVFSLLDSHTTTSHFSNVRIDNYVYTIEALKAARRLLKPDGVFIIKFQVQRPWIAGRLHDLVVATFGSEPLHVQAAAGYNTSGRFFIAGSEAKIAAALQDERLRNYVAAGSRMPMESARLTTDDWPYFYQREAGLPTSVATISLLLIVVSFSAANRIGITVRSIRAEFFFLGAGFLLLEAQIVSRMALLFGTTWVVNSIVISTLLFLIVLANIVASRFPAIPVSLAYGAILVTCVASYVIPTDALFFRSFWLRALISTAVVSLPVFFAGIVFIRRFAAADFGAEAIGSNLLGALAGGISESISLWLGLRSMLLLAAILYAGAWLSSRRQRNESGATDAATAREAA